MEKPTYTELEQRIRVLEKEASERKKVEEALRESEERLKDVQKMGKMGHWEFDMESQKTSWSDQMYELFDRDPGQGPLHFLEARSQYDPGDAERMWKEGLRALETGESFKMDFRTKLSSGRTAYFCSTYHPIKDETGRITKLRGTVQDIGERKQAEQILRESEDKLRAIFENVNEEIIFLDNQGNVIDHNKEVDIFGYSREEIIGKNFAEFKVVRPEDLESLMEKFEQVSAGRHMNLIELEGLRKDGSEIVFEVSTSLIKKDGEVKNIVVALRDITERKKLEAQLRQAQRMDSIGTLAGGIAHDFNNLLMGIQGRTSMMLMDVNASHPHIEHLKGIETYVKNAADLTKQLLDFARGGKYEVKPIDLNELIKEQNRMFGRTKKEISIRGKYETNMWTAEVDQGQIKQVLLNLYVNAWQAMPGGGDLYIQTENVILDQKYVKPFQVRPGKYVKLSVTDTGAGMDDATRQRIFDPFFTTKEMGRGTGLGLASVYGIIKNHAGFINVYSEKGQGTTFTIYLPASEKEVNKETELSDRVLRGNETVLLVDDEEMIIEVGKETLKKLGYNVLTARSGKEAIEIYASNKDRIALVVLDMVMPKMGGGETYSNLKVINPDIKTILSSGYSLEGRATEILKQGCDGFIQKPFSLIELSQKIREVLDV